MSSIITIFVKAKYFLSWGMLCGYYVIQEISKTLNIIYQICINPCWEFMFWFHSDTQAGSTQNLLHVGAETAACGQGEKLPVSAKLSVLVL